MRKINKITNIALIFTLIGVFLCATLVYASSISHLRAPVGDYKGLKKALDDQSFASNQKTTEFSNGLIDMENLGESKTALPIINFTVKDTLFPLYKLEPKLTKYIESLEITYLFATLYDLMLNALEYQSDSSDAVSMKIDKIKAGEILKITINQKSSSRDARNRLAINEGGFNLQGPDYLIDEVKREKSSALVRRGQGLRNIAKLMKERPLSLIYKIGQEEPFPIETNLYIKSPGTSNQISATDKEDQTIASGKTAGNSVAPAVKLANVLLQPNQAVLGEGIETLRQMGYQTYFIRTGSSLLPIAEIEKLARQIGFEQEKVTEFEGKNEQRTWSGDKAMGHIAHELTGNILRHANRNGVLLVRKIIKDGQAGIELITVDARPGMKIKSNIKPRKRSISGYGLPIIHDLTTYGGQGVLIIESRGKEFPISKRKERLSRSKKGAK